MAPNTADENDPAVSGAGLAQVQAAFANQAARRGIAYTLGFRGVDVRSGWVALEGYPTEDHYNPLGTVHGGYAATLLDSAIGLAVQSQLPANVVYSTTDLNVTFVRAMTSASSPVRAEGSVIHAGKRLAVGEARLLDKDGCVCAFARASCILIPLAAVAAASP